MSLSNATKGTIAGTALFAGTLVGAIFDSEPSTPAPVETTASGCAASHFAYQHNSAPCEHITRHQVLVVIGRTVVGCSIGGVAGPEGILPGCLGGVASTFIR